MLGRSERESGAQALLAATSAGWSAGEPAEAGPDVQALLDLGSTTATLSTVASIDGLAAVVHLGHPAQPSHELERALLAGPPSLVLTGATAVPAQWVWVGRSASARELTGHVVVDEAGMRDRRHVLRTMGVSPSLVPTRTSLEDRVALAGPDGSLVVERSVAEGTLAALGYAELSGSELLGEGAPVWYGLLESREKAPRVEGVAQVWLAFGPRDDHRGSLQETLSLVARAGIDLQHLRSHRSQAGPHIFFCAFSCPDAETLDGLVGGFAERGVAHRVLAVLPGQEFVPGPDALEPRWASAPEPVPA
ncbi:hypothetical protein [Cellulosimicrobium protaetiae]|uniref:Uncharacterized protein n=1 Tax=Cellulosimicrobium protaetiae TaxID=2587808 RepID=A0A6M5UGU9_9MICO|nr:hypothetical protein [Cellulosimicrobium protaetiae]QJW37324.1 hypothetical protein FIC82_015200 [Cellulosimicrobium protaetiae]